MSLLFHSLTLLLLPIIALSQGSSVPGDENWNKGIAPFNFNGPVHAIEIAPNGDIYVGGEFSMVGTTPIGGIARWDGTTWSALGTGVSGSVRAIAFNGTDLYAGGFFTQAGGVKATNIARWDGTAWHAFGDITNEGLDSTVFAIAVRDTAVYVGGSFTYSGNQDQLNYIARWDAAQKLFVPLNDGTRRGMDGMVSSILIAGDSLFVGGGFTKAGGTNTSRIARWNGSEWGNMGAGIGATQGITPFIHAIALRDSFLYIAGRFTAAGGRPTRNVARWNFSAGTWGGFTGTGVNGVDSVAHDIAFSETGNIYITGGFMSGGGTSASRIVRWNGTSSGWTALGSGIDGTGHALAMVGDNLYVGGEFTQAGGTSSPNFARWTEAPILGVEDNLSMTGADAAIIATPNPSANTIRIAFALTAPAYTTVEIVNMRGEPMATLVAERLEAGTHLVEWNANGIPAGTYLCRVQNGGTNRAMKVMVVR